MDPEGEFVVVLRQGDGRVNARLGLVDEEDLAGEAADGRRGGARGGGCRGEAGEVLDDAIAEDGGVQGAPVEAGRRVDRFEIDGVQHGRLDEDHKEDPTEIEAVGAEQRVVAEDDVKYVLEGHAEVRTLFILRRYHVGGGVGEER